MYMLKNKQTILSVFMLCLLGVLLITVYVANTGRQTIVPRAQVVSTTSTTGTGTGTTSGGACTTNLTAIALDPTKLCGVLTTDISSSAYNATYKCSDGSTGLLGDGVTCRDLSSYKCEGFNICTGKCGMPPISCSGVPPIPTGSGTLTPIPTRSDDLTPVPTSGTESCPDGIKSTTYKPCALNTSTTPTSTYSAAIVTCYDDSMIPIPPFLTKSPPTTTSTTSTTTSSCITQADFDAIIAAHVPPLCAGLRSPSCMAIPTVAPTGTTKVCATRSIGDCNCDGQVEITSDFACWRPQYKYIDEAPCRSADFNGDGQCTLADFEILRQNALNK